jgi:drug/metabolite transporter (DMT)-like permease
MPVGPSAARMDAVTFALVLSLASGCGYAVSAVLQQRLAAGLDTPLGWLAALRFPSWWLAIGLNGAAALLHVAALRYGPLTVVQPLGVLTLVLALPLGAAIGGRSVTRLEWRGAVATVAGLAGMVLLTASAMPTRALDTPEVVVVAATTAVAIGVLASLGLRYRHRRVSGVCFGGAAGVAFGISSALTQTVTVEFAVRGIVGLANVATVTIVALIVVGVLLLQAGYRSGLAAPLASATLANPLAAALIGLTLLDERYGAGVIGGGFAVVSAIVAGYGVATLTGVVLPSRGARLRRTDEPLWTGPVS